jgi:hypothetical protein
MAMQSVNVVAGKKIKVGSERAKRTYTSADNPISIQAHEAKKLIARGLVTAA